MSSSLPPCNDNMPTHDSASPSMPETTNESALLPTRVMGSPHGDTISNPLHSHSHSHSQTTASAPEETTTISTPHSDRTDASAFETGDYRLMDTASIGSSKSSRRSTGTGSFLPQILRPSQSRGHYRRGKHRLRTTISSSLEDLPPDQRPSNLQEFFSAFWMELGELIRELIQYARAKTWKKKILTVLVSACSILVFYDLFFGDYILQYLEEFIFWMSVHSAIAVLAFVVLFVVATLIFIPPTFLVFGAGFAFSQAIGFGWGILAAILSCTAGSCIGATLAFWRSRYMMRDLIELFSKRYPIIRAADRAFKRKGFKIMLLLRLCPLLPFNGLNYCCGITDVTLEDFILSLVGILPFQIFIVVVGATTGTFALTKESGLDYTASQQLGFVILVAFGVATSIIALVYSWKIVKKELQKELQLTPTQFDELLHPWQAAKDVASQGGIEPSIEVSPLPLSNPDVEGSGSWGGDDDEEWFWVWT